MRVKGQNEVLLNHIYQFGELAPPEGVDHLAMTDIANKLTSDLLQPGTVDFEGQKFKINRGTPQGSLISPTAFAVYIDEVLLHVAVR